MTIVEVREKLVNLLEEQGCIIPDYADKTDIVLTDYFVDSLAYMLFLISVEEEFGIEIPDECLSLDFTSSFIGFSCAICSIVNRDF